MQDFNTPKSTPSGWPSNDEASTPSRDIEVRGCGGRKFDACTKTGRKSSVDVMFFLHFLPPTLFNLIQEAGQRPKHVQQEAAAMHLS